jgi:hypothetical protein
MCVGLYGMQLGPDGMDFVGAVFDAVSKAWDQWQNAIQFGALTLAGAGVGAWAGVGMGGVMGGAPFIMQPLSFKSNSAQQLQFTQGLIQALQAKMSPWPSTFSFTALNFIGTSTATPIAPGSFTANCVPTTLIGCGSSQAPSGIADMWKSTLTPPAWDLENPQAKSGQLIKAIGDTIEQTFQTIWLATTMASGDAGSGAAAPGGVVAGFPSLPGGKLV